MGKRKADTVDAVTVVPKNERATKRTPEIIDAILQRVSGHESLRAICADLGVPVSTFLGWVADSAELTEQYARAKRAQAEMLALEIVQIADEAQVEVKHDGEDVVLDLSPIAVARNRLRVDARKWVASKLLPKVYGDKLAIGGAEDLPPVQQNVVLDPSEAYKRLIGGGE